MSLQTQLCHWTLYQLSCTSRSCAKLAYDDAQRVIEGDILPVDVDIFGNHDDYAISNDILMLHDLSVQLRQQRYDGGSLSMNSVKLQFALDDKGEPISFSQYEAKAANRLIEEFMLLANISIAHKIAKAFPDEALLRRHEAPLSKRLVRVEWFIHAKRNHCWHACIEWIHQDDRGAWPQFRWP